MKKILVIVSFIIGIGQAYSQTAQFDLVRYTAPAGWQKIEKPSVITYIYVDPKDKSWCKISLYRSIASTGTLAADFDLAWKELVAGPLQISEPPLGSTTDEADGWQIQSAAGKYVFEGANSIALLTAFSGYGRTIDILATTSGQRYLTNIEAFIGSLEIDKPNTAPSPPELAATPKVSGQFSYRITNFDDGWTSTVQENWVAVEKGRLKVLIHYPVAEEKKYYSNTDEELRLFWNLLVAPRYSSLKNFRVSFPSSYEPGKIAAGTVTDRTTGKSLYVVLFKKGNSNWMEFIAPDQQSFIQAFGINIDNLDAFFTAWDPLVRMGGYNKFAIAAADLSGTWSSSFSGVTQYVNVNTGNSAGMDTHSSSQTFEFQGGQRYNWSISAANGFVGNIKFQSAKSAGQFSVLNNWTIRCSEIEGKPKTYNAYFSCIRGARILWLEDQSYAQGYTGFGKVE